MEKAQDFLSLNLRRIRKEQRMTQLELADLVGCSMPTIQRIETGSQFPRSEMISALAEALKVSEMELFKDPFTKTEPTKAKTVADMTPEELAEALSQIQEKNKKLEETKIPFKKSLSKDETDKENLLSDLSESLKLLDTNEIRNLSDMVGKIIARRHGPIKKPKNA